MAKRKSRKVVRKKVLPKLETDFDCPFCGNTKCIQVKLESKTHIGTLWCRVCTVHYVRNGLPKLVEAVDVYGDWLDECMAANAPQQHHEEERDFDDNDIAQQKEPYTPMYSDHNEIDDESSNASTTIRQEKKNPSSQNDLFVDGSEDEDNVNAKDILNYEIAESECEEHERKRGKRLRLKSQNDNNDDQINYDESSSHTSTSQTIPATSSATIEENEELLPKANEVHQFKRQRTEGEPPPPGDL